MLLLVIYLLLRPGCPSQQFNQSTHAQNIQAHLFPSLSRQYPIPSQFPSSPPPHSQKTLLNLHQSDVVGTPSDAGRWPLLSHMRLLQELPASSYLSLLPAATARRRPNTVRVLYSTKYKTYNWDIQIHNTHPYTNTYTCSTPTNLPVL